MSIKCKPYYDKKGNLRTEKNINLPSKRTKEYYESMANHMLLNKPKWMAMKQGVEFPLHVLFTFIRDSKRKFDVINPCQTIQDLMVHSGWLEDDNSEIIIPYFGIPRVDKNNPGVEIQIIKNVTYEAI